MRGQAPAARCVARLAPTLYRCYQYLPACSARALHVCMCRMRIHGARYNGSTGTVVPVPVLGIPTMILDLVDLFEYTSIASSE